MCEAVWCVRKPEVRGGYECVHVRTCDPRLLHGSYATATTTQTQKRTDEPGRREITTTYALSYD